MHWSGQVHKRALESRVWEDVLPKVRIWLTSRDLLLDIEEKGALQGMCFAAWSGDLRSSLDIPMLKVNQGTSFMSLLQFLGWVGF